MAIVCCLPWWGPNNIPYRIQPCLCTLQMKTEDIRQISYNLLGEELKLESWSPDQYSATVWTLSWWLYYILTCKKHPFLAIELLLLRTLTEFYNTPKKNGVKLLRKPASPHPGFDVQLLFVSYCFQNQLPSLILFMKCISIVFNLNLLANSIYLLFFFFNKYLLNS